MTKISTSTPTGKFMLTVFGAVAELEREYILQRQAEGIEIVKQEGKYKGRKKIENDKFDKVYKDWRAESITAIRAMELLGMKRNTFYRRVSEFEAKD
jgi:DNA invertase Pin-like site-specific DNA recombinase